MLRKLFIKKTAEEKERNETSKLFRVVTKESKKIGRIKAIRELPEQDFKRYK